MANIYDVYKQALHDALSYRSSDPNATAESNIEEMSKIFATIMTTAFEVTNHNLIVRTVDDNNNEVAGLINFV